jgi:hypothetical protein
MSQHRAQSYIIAIEAASLTAQQKHAIERYVNDMEQKLMWYGLKTRRYRTSIKQLQRAHLANVHALKDAWHSMTTLRQQMEQARIAARVNAIAAKEEGTRYP